jgi:hypothetical protein
MVELDGGGRVYGRLVEQAGAKSSISANKPLALDADATRERGYPVYRLA